MEHLFLRRSGAGKNTRAVLYFFPAAALLLVFFIGPMFLSILFSFTNLSLTGSTARSLEFVGFRNFIEIFRHRNIQRIISNTLVFLIFSGIAGQQCLGFVMAYLMKKKNPFVRRFIGFTIIAGWVTPEIICAFMFLAFFDDQGVLNSIISNLGISPVSWLFAFPMVCVVTANIWKGSAYSMMMFQASLDNIPDEILEAGSIDGAGRFQLLTRIILPMIKGTMATTFIIVTLATLGAFGLIYGMKGISVQTATLSVFMYQNAFISYQIGAGMAIALFILVIGVVFSLVYTRIIKAEM